MKTLWCVFVVKKDYNIIYLQENHTSTEQNDAKSIPKKRRWGTILTPTDPTPAFSVSTESLKVLVPGAKPLSVNEVRLSKDDDDERDRRNQREKRYSTSESGTEHKPREDGEKPKNSESKKDAKGDNHMGKTFFQFTFQSFFRNS